MPNGSEDPFVNSIGILSDAVNSKSGIRIECKSRVEAKKMRARLHMTKLNAIRKSTRESVESGEYWVSGFEDLYIGFDSPTVVIVAPSTKENLGVERIEEI